MGVFHAISSDTYFNSALDGTAVAVVSSGGMGATANAGIGGGSYQATHARITCLHATQYAAALIGDSGTAAISSGNFSVIAPPLGKPIIVPLSRARRVSIVASAGSTPVAIEFGIYRS